MTKTKTWDELTIKDNFLFQKVMRNKRICKMLIEEILQIKIKKIAFSFVGRRKKKTLYFNDGFSW